MLLDLAEQQLGMLPCINVDVHSDPLFNGSILINHRRRADVRPAPFTARSTEAELRINKAAGFDRLAPLPLGILTVMRVDSIDPTVAKPFLKVLAGTCAPGGAVNCNGSSGIRFPHRLSRTANQKTVPGLALPQSRLRVCRIGVEWNSCCRSIPTSNWLRTKGHSFYRVEIDEQDGSG